MVKLGLGEFADSDHKVAANVWRNGFSGLSHLRNRRAIFVPRRPSRSSSVAPASGNNDFTWCIAEVRPGGRARRRRQGEHLRHLQTRGRLRSCLRLHTYLLPHGVVSQPYFGTSAEAQAAAQALGLQEIGKISRDTCIRGPWAGHDQKFAAAVLTTMAEPLIADIRICTRIEIVAGSAVSCSAKREHRLAQSNAVRECLLRRTFARRCRIRYRGLEARRPAPNSAGSRQPRMRRSSPYSAQCRRPSSVGKTPDAVPPAGGSIAANRIS